MNGILKDRVRSCNEDRRASIRKDMIEDKIEMQESFIKDIEKSGKERIDRKEKQVENLHKEVDVIMDENDEKTLKIMDELQPKLENLNNTKKTLKKLNTIKVKLEQKIQNIVEEHKFFEDNTVCPTCTQPLEEQFRTDKIVDIQEKSKELNEGYKELEATINVEQEKDIEFTIVLQRLTDSTMTFQQTMLEFLGLTDKSRILERKFKTLPIKYQTEILNERPLKTSRRI